MEPISTISAVDHAFAAILLVALPLLAQRSFGRLQRRVLQGDRAELRRTYHKSLVKQAAIGLALIFAWLWLGRSLTGLGLAAPAGSGFLAGLAIAVVLLTYAGLQIRAVGRSERLRARTRERLEATGLRSLVPVSADEYRTFAAVALSAGVWEELLFRGFLVAYFAHWIGMGPGVVVAALAFGIGHLYQGVAGVLKTGVAGLIAGGLYLLTGTLWISMLLHTAVDLHAGTLGYLTADDGPEPAVSSG